MKRLLAASACALALGATSASAAPWSVTIDGGYQGMNCCHETFDGYYYDGAASIPLGISDLSLELNLGDRALIEAHDFDAGGSLVWNGGDLRVAATVLYNDISFGGFSANETQYGGGAEWYVNPWLTVSGQGGGFTGQVSAGYVGGTVKGYVMPDLSLAGNVLYTSISGGAHETDYGLSAEWLVLKSSPFPVALNAGYQQVDFSNGVPNFQYWKLGLSIYLNGQGATTLVDKNRTGTLDTIGPVRPLIYSVF
jgi:hypothetical protein